MSLNVIKKVIDLGDGRTIEIETGKLAKQADGSVVIKMGDTMLLATVVSSLEAKEGVDFLPLSVDYQEKYAATGRIPGGFLRREARLSDYEVLISRLVDRALRPMFPEDYHADTQVMITLFLPIKTLCPIALQVWRHQQLYQYQTSLSTGLFQKFALLKLTDNWLSTQH